MAADLAFACSQEFPNSGTPPTPEPRPVEIHSTLRTSVYPLVPYSPEDFHYIFIPQAGVCQICRGYCLVYSSRQCRRSLPCCITVVIVPAKVEASLRALGLGRTPQRKQEIAPR